ncbi:hypothetical protein DH2020_006270 [Rehmannia glutinosa]|uniref:tRNA(Ile)-lysidine synthetase n=1 Tax=Rehmannia glutinosa TaxID=99300 RepID=A0ABR0XJ01_REHGL
MAARGILMPLHVHTKTTASTPPVVITTFISWLEKGSRPRRARFSCSQSHRLPEIDMSKYREKFAQRMAMAGIKPHHRIAMAVSGGPDSIALCILTAGWKSDNCDAAAAKGRSKSIDDLLAIVVDHGLRTESAEEANLVYNRVLDMGVKCEVARCEWLDGRPKLGHLQEAARNKRYETLQNICIQQKISILLIAHHADDQAELFILRLSRNSGVLGLAGMAFISQMFAEFPDFSGDGSKAHGILLVRPLLEFSKEDMYNICHAGNQQWVEDPTNRSPSYARNRIRMQLNNISSPIFKAELQAAISACRRTRVHVDKHCHLLLNNAVTVMPHGYAVIDLGTLHSMEVQNIYLAKLVASLLQFISQRHKPVRGNALKLLLGYLRTFPCKTSLTVASCYLCPAPGSKGTKVLVCCSVGSSLPLVMKFCEGQNCLATSELEEIVTDGETYLDVLVPDSPSVPFLDVTCFESVLMEAKRLGILSHSTYKSIISLQKEESDSFYSKAEAIPDFVPKDYLRSSSVPLSKSIYPGQVGYFMNRFVLDWKVCDTVSYDVLSTNEYVSVKEVGAEDQCSCSSCIIGDEMVAEVRHMIDADWIYLSDLSKKTNQGDSRPDDQPAVKPERLIGKATDYAILSASRALASLKSIPVAARRALPVLVNSKGVLLSIPSIGFSHCPDLMVSAVFNPRIPLGGGHSSFL